MGSMTTNTSRVSKKEYFGYFCYGFGECFNYGLVGTFILFFYTDILGISAAAASIIFLIARVWDAANDPVCAGIMDMRRTKEGKFKGYLKIIPIFVVISTTACFFAPDISLQGKVLYAGFTYIMWGVFYTISDIPFWSVSAVISGDTKEKANLACAANIGVAGGIGLASIMIPLLVQVFSNQAVETRYFLAVLILSLVGFGFMMFGYSTITERVEPPKNEKVKVRDVINALKVNKHLFRILAVFIFKFCYDVVQSIIVFFFTYNLGNATLMSVFGVIATVSALGIVVLPLLTKKFRKKDIFIAVCVLDIVLRLVWYVLGYENLAVTMVILALTAFLNALTIPCVSMMLQETIEYSEVKTGKRCEAITFAGQTFTGKLAVALAGSGTGLILTLIQYNPNGVQTDFTLNGIFLAVCVVPAIGSLCRMLLLLGYKYTETEHEKDVEILRSRRGVVQSDEMQREELVSREPVQFERVN
ncbi:sodium:galactoside symporter [Butyricicoccus faecihominis]|uniref:Sodium:galactoside symporter n=1 Tax=Butyricicoccus faecihominis TaxID=1712515 RepID=A0ABQ1E1H2_9FIRM|nr:glycoside-pentoside-hexuronide (GPH):cation symporter [Butyricicoccus faecihominis]GFO88800.1 sodium:galactoside symporter [Butyricicoccus faecihominis]GGM65942.1 sodium:galactoside symporter [Butyricicoccus faecihominis]